LTRRAVCAELVANAGVIAPVSSTPTVWSPMYMGRRALTSLVSAVRSVSRRVYNDEVTTDCVPIGDDFLKAHLDRGRQTIESARGLELL